MLRPRPTSDICFHKYSSYSAWSIIQHEATSLFMYSLGGGLHLSPDWLLVAVKTSRLVQGLEPLPLPAPAVRLQLGAVGQELKVIVLVLANHHDRQHGYVELAVVEGFVAVPRALRAHHSDHVACCTPVSACLKRALSRMYLMSFPLCL